MTGFTPSTKWTRSLLLFCLAATLFGCDNTTPQEHIEAAELAIADSKANAAIIELKNALRKNPQNVEARALLGRTRFLQGDIEEALKDLTRAVDLGAEDMPTELAFLRSKTLLGDHLAVIGVLEERPNLTPEQAVALGEAYLFAQDWTSARSYLQRGLHLADGLYGMARLAMMNNDPEQASKYAAQALDKAPKLFGAWLVKGEAELALGNAPDALEAFKQAAGYPANRIKALTGEVRAHLLADELDSADAVVTRLVAAAKNYPYALYLQGLIKFRQADYGQAQRPLQQAVRIAPDNTDALRLLALVKYELRETDKAEGFLQRVLEVNQRDAWARKLLARIMTERRQPQEVVRLLQPIAIEQADPQVWAMLGNALMQTGETGQATEAYESAVAIAPGVSVFRNQLALSLLSSGASDQAADELSSALELGDSPLQSEYLLVLIKVKEGDFQAAREITRGIAEREEDQAIGFYLSGLVAIAEEDRALAEAEFKRALGKAPDYFPASRALAQLALSQGDSARAREHWQQALAADSANESAAQALVQLDIQEGDLSSALERLEAMVEQFPSSTQMRSGLSRLYMGMGRFDDARGVVDIALERAPQNPELLFLLADIYTRSGEVREAKKTADQLQTAVNDLPDNANQLAALGALQLRLELYSAARRNLRKALDLMAETPPQVLTNLARLEIADQNPSGAQRYLDQLTNTAQASEEVALLQGDVYILGGQQDAALQQYQMTAGEGSRNAAVKAALLMLQNEAYEPLDKFLSDWLASNESDEGIQSLLASARVQLGDLKAAKEQYESMMPSKDPVVLNNLAWIYLVENDRRALATARRAHQIAPDNPDVQDTLGWILVKDGQAEEALTLLQSSARARRDNGAVHYHLGVAYWEVGDKEKATQALRRAVDLGDFEELDEARAALDRVSNS